MKMIILPRQARDKHRERSKKRSIFTQGRALFWIFEKLVPI
jgi:hypothetical protein